MRAGRFGITKTVSQKMKTFINVGKMSKKERNIPINHYCFQVIVMTMTPPAPFGKMSLKLFLGPLQKGRLWIKGAFKILALLKRVCVSRFFWI